MQDIVGSETFFACLWEAILGSPSVRLSALIYVNAKFDRRKPMDDQLYIMGNNVDHMVFNHVIYMYNMYKLFAIYLYITFF